MFHDKSGGYIVQHKEHQFSELKPKGALLSGGEAEQKVANNIARNGKHVEMSAENAGYKKSSSDLKFDGMTWDVKYIDAANSNTIRSYFKDAKKADNVIFYTSSQDRSNEILVAVEREMGRYRSIGKDISKLPDVYVMSGEGELKLLKKIK